MPDPVAPTPAPVASVSAPSAAPAPAAAPTAPVHSDPFVAELHSKFDAEDAKGSPPKAPEAKTTPEPAKEPAKPAAAPTPAAKTPEPIAPVQPANEGPKALRERKAQLETELATERASIGELKKKLEQFEAKGKDTEALLTQIDEAKKQIEAIQAENRMLKQETSPEFKKQYDEPFNRAAEFAKSMVVGLDKADGTPSTWENFAALYGVSKQSVNKAMSEARAMFGENAGVVIQQLTKLHELNYTREVALQQEKAQWQERTKADEGKAAETRARAAREQEQQKQQFADTFQKVNKDLEDTVEAYRVAPEDKELTDARTRFLSIYDSQPKTADEFLAKNAHIRQRAAAFEVNQIVLKRKDAEIAELKKKLDGLNPKPPGGDAKRQGGAEAGTPAKSWEQEARDAVMNAR